MKSLSVGIAGLCILLAFEVTPSRAQPGFAVGLNYNEVSDLDVGDAQATFDNRTGWHAEFWFELPLFRQLVLQPGLRYMDAGALYEGLSDEEPGIADDFSVFLLEAPINVRLRLGDDLVAPYLLAGPVVRVPLSAGDELNDDLEELSLAGELGAGLEVAFGALRLFPEITYTFGISGFIDDEFDVGDVTFSTDDEQFLNALMLRVGVGF